MALMALACVERGWTQPASDILAFLLRQPDVCARIREIAEEAFCDLESRICPRVIHDARAFAADMDLQTVVEYLLDVLKYEPNLTTAQRSDLLA